MQASSNPGSGDDGSVITDAELQQYMPQPGEDGLILPERSTAKKPSVPSWRVESSVIDLTQDDGASRASPQLQVVDLSDEESAPGGSTLNESGQKHQRQVVPGNPGDAERAHLLAPARHTAAVSEAATSSNGIEKHGYSSPPGSDSDELMEEAEDNDRRVHMTADTGALSQSGSKRESLPMAEDEEDEDEELEPEDDEDDGGMIPGSGTETDFEREQTTVPAFNNDQDMLQEDEYQLEDTSVTSLGGGTNSRPRTASPLKSTDTANQARNGITTALDEFRDFDMSGELSEANSSLLESPAVHRPAPSVQKPYTHPPPVSLLSDDDSDSAIKMMPRQRPIEADHQVLKKRKCTMLPTGYVYDICMFFHAELESLDGDAPHPESPYRIYKIYKRLQGEGLLDQCVRINGRYATRHEILRVHDEDHYNMMRVLEDKSRAELIDLAKHYDSLYLNAESFNCALLSAGSVIEACVAVVKDTVKNAFAIVRPPGHHAEHAEPMGFCLFNNVAVAISYLREHHPEVGRILVVDWDIHFGNGTQRLTNGDRDVLYMSLHRYDNQEFYPGDSRGRETYCGTANGKGRTVNIPWSWEDVTDGDYIYAFQQVVMPIAMEFAPSLVIVSAGFDAALGDHIGRCCVTPAGYGQMTHMLKSLANGRLMLALEGGYNLEAIAKSAAACMGVLVGEAPELPEIIHPTTQCAKLVKRIKRIQAEHWQCFA